MTERAVTFLNANGQQLVGVYHEPTGKVRGAIVMLHGWSGTRCGPHQMLTRAARFLCGHGFAVLRFDFSGRGDSDGETQMATLSTMQSDAHVAFDWIREQTPAPLLVLGLCSGCEIAVASVGEAVKGAILWSAPVFAALPSPDLAARKRGENFKKYARKLLKLSTYAKIWRRQIDTQSVSKALAGGGGGASKNHESNQPGQLPPGFRRAALANWRAWKAPRLHIYGDADPIMTTASDWYRQNSGIEGKTSLISGANHSFYGLDWERQVFLATLSWLESQNWD